MYDAFGQVRLVAGIVAAAFAENLCIMHQPSNDHLILHASNIKVGW